MVLDKSRKYDLGHISCKKGCLGTKIYKRGKVLILGGLLSYQQTVIKKTTTCIKHANSDTVFQIRRHCNFLVLLDLTSISVSRLLDVIDNPYN